MLKAGMIIAERYEVLGKIGTGGMADVYKAKDHKLNRFVAVKVLKPEFREDKTFIRKFRSEAQAAAGLTHPNIVNVFDVGDDEGVYYIVMELIEGITLKEYIAKKGKLSIKEATSIAIQVSMGLEAAHNHGIVHRDVKPQNIIISTDGKVKVTDFGIARAASSNTISSNVMGSVHYSSPEQVRGGYSDEKSDIYSLGITLYEMVTGRVPFDGDTTVAIAIKHLQEEMVPPSVYTENLPYSLEQIIFKCTQKSVDRRYASMSELIEDLKHSLLDPNGNFVSLTPLASHAQTVMLSQDELDAIREGRSGYAVPQRNAAYEEDEEEYEEDDDEEYEDDEDDDEGEISSKLEKAMTIGGFIIGAIIICILIFFIAKAAGFVNFGDSKKDDQKIEEQQEDDQSAKVDENGQVAVPNLLSQTEENAVELLEQLGLKGNKTGESSSSEYGAGVVMSQEIAEGTKVDQGTVINYTVSTGSDAPVVPEVNGMTQSQAEAAIKALGLETSIQQQYSDTVGIGKVISADPGAGTTLAAGQTVTLVVSLGEENKQVAVPNVFNMDENTAKQTLQDNSFKVNVETTEESSGANEGCVASQSVAAGTEVDPGTNITIYIYHAPAVTPTPETTTPEPTAPTATPEAGSWKCNVKLTRPANFTDGPVRLRLVQNVNGQNVETVLMDGETITFPEDGYPLSVEGAANVESGTIYLEELVDGTYVERGHYSNVPFKQS